MLTKDAYVPSDPWDRSTVQPLDPVVSWTCSGGVIRTLERTAVPTQVPQDHQGVRLGRTDSLTTFESAGNAVREGASRV